MPEVAERPHRWRDRMFQMRLHVFVLVVPGIALACWAAIYNMRNRDVDRSLISRHIDALRSSGDVIERRGAAYQLDSVPAARLSEAVDALLIGLRDPDAQVRRNSAMSLATSILRYYNETSGDAPADRDRAVLAIVGALRDPDASVRSGAAGALELLINADQTTGLKGMKPVVDPRGVRDLLLDLLDDPDAKVIRASYKTLLAMKAAPRLRMATLDRLLEPGEASQRVKAVDWLVLNIRDRQALLDRLIALLDDPAHEVRHRAMSHLAMDNTDPARVAHVLAERLARDANVDRASLLSALASIRPLPDDLVPALLRALEPRRADQADGSIDTANAVSAISNASPAAMRAALPAMCLAAERRMVGGTGLYIAWQIARIDASSPEARRLAPLVIDTLARASDDMERHSAIDFVRSVDPSLFAQIVPKWIDDLRSGKPDVVTAACVTLARIGPQAKQAVPELAKLARREINPNRVQFVASRALFANAPGSPEAAGWLLEAGEFYTDPKTAPKVSAAALGLIEQMLTGLGLSFESELRPELDSNDPMRTARAEALLKTITEHLDRAMDEQAKPVTFPTNGGRAVGLA